MRTRVSKPKAVAVIFIDHESVAQWQTIGINYDQLQSLNKRNARHAEKTKTHRQTHRQNTDDFSRDLHTGLSLSTCSIQPPVNPSIRVQRHALPPIRPAHVTDADEKGRRQTIDRANLNAK